MLFQKRLFLIFLATLFFILTVHHVVASEKGGNSEGAFELFTARFPVHIDNTGYLARESWPIVLPLKAIKLVVKDFNPRNCAVVESGRVNGQAELPHQVDFVDQEPGLSDVSTPTEGEFCFQVDVPADRKVTYWIYYTPSGERNKRFPKRTGMASNWPEHLAANIGWESNRAAYRCYDGRFDFFGKYEKSRKAENLIFPLSNFDYHKMQPWGIDALVVGDSPGLGGLALVTATGAQYPVYNKQGRGPIRFRKRLLSAGPIRAAVEISATNIISDNPDLRLVLQCIIYDNRRETEIRVGANTEAKNIMLAPSLDRLSSGERFLNAKLGFLGEWGSQTEVIGEIGLGVIVEAKKLIKVSQTKQITRLACGFKGGEMKYWIVGQWKRGRKNPASANVENWKRELAALAYLLNNDVDVEIGDLEKLQ